MRVAINAATRPDDLVPRVRHLLSFSGFPDNPRSDLPGVLVADVTSKQCYQFFVGIFDVCHVHAKRQMTTGASAFDRYAIVELCDQDLSCCHDPSLRSSHRLSSAVKSDCSATRVTRAAEIHLACSQP